MGSDERWMQFRRFGRLQARLLLEKQEEVRELQVRLDDFDENDFKRAAEDDDGEDESDDRDIPWRLTRRSRPDQAEQEARQKLMDDAGRKFKEYADLLVAAKSLISFEKPAEYEYLNVRNFIQQTGSFRPAEADWINDHMDDIITLRGEREHAWIRSKFERIVNMLQDVVLPEETAEPELMKKMIKQSKATDEKAGIAIMIMLLACGPLFFVVPIYALSRIGDNISKSLGLLVGLAFLFILLLTKATSAKPREVVSCSAA